MVLKINGLTLSLGEGEDVLPGRVASLLGLPKGAVTELRVMRRSIDARRARPPRFVYLVALRLPDGTPWSVGAAEKGLTVTEVPDTPDGAQSAPSAVPFPAPEGRTVVVGCGPAGLFSALTLARRGVAVLLLERGRPVTDRLGDIRAFWERGRFNPESHVHFGEGGAGTFSDGKLTSRANHPYTDWVKRTLVEMGAPADILVDGRPHVGT
ncbi:MAG: FAD-dependent monooxygenase, partial [Thermodesulfobacteriota bacterium]